MEGPLCSARRRRRVHLFALFLVLLFSYSFHDHSPFFRTFLYMILSSKFITEMALLSPCIASPESFDFPDVGPMPVRRTLLLMGKVLQCLANGVTEFKEVRLQFCITIICDHLSLPFSELMIMSSLFRILSHLIPFLYRSILRAWCPSWIGIVSSWKSTSDTFASGPRVPTANPSRSLCT